ncbi:hypothetical protein HDU79_003760 [Rhizoclosmatium sp. JEL0117]|nr:hypothetical protein HDU79_003760 [Rhizoclosmatium sp. JEL0117]
MDEEVDYGDELDNDIDAAEDSLEDLFGGEVSDDDDDDGDNQQQQQFVVDETQPLQSQSQNQSQANNQLDLGLDSDDEDDDRQPFAAEDAEEAEEADSQPLSLSLSQSQSLSQLQSQSQQIDDEPVSVLPLALPKVAPAAQPGSDSHLAKLPHFLAVEPAPFDKAAFAKSLDPSILNDEEKLLRLENTVRWRYADASSNNKDSNARIVKWSDGSFSLLLGDEIFDCQLKSNNKAHHYLASLHPRERVLQNHLRIRDTVMFVSSKSGQTHKRMTAAIAKKHLKEKGTKLFTDTKYDPIQAKKEAEKREREAIMAAKKMHAERQKTANAYGGSGRDGGRETDRYAGRRYEDYSDEEDMDQARRRPTTTNLDAYEEDFVEDDDVLDDGGSDSEEERRREEKLRNAKRSRRDEDEDGGGSASKKSAAKRRIIDSDDDE